MPIREHVLLARVTTQLRVKALTDQLRGFRLEIAQRSGNLMARARSEEFAILLPERACEVYSMAPLPAPDRLQ